MPRTRRQASRSTSRRRGEPADREPSLAGAFGHLLRSARGLHAEPDPLQVEAFASSVLSTFPSLLVDVDDPEAFFGKRLVDYLVARRSDDALALLHGLAATASSETLARLAHAGALRLRVAGRTDPGWAGTIGRARFVEAFTPVDPYEEQHLVVSTFEYPDGRRHALVFLVDQNFDGLARQAHLTPDPDDIRHALVESGDMALRPVDAQEVADRLAQGLLLFDMTIDPPCDQELPPLVPLLRARQRALPPPVEMEQPELSDRQRDAIFDEFARSKEAGRSKRAIALAELFVDCRLQRLDADPFRWSPIAVELCLLDWLPRKVTLDVDEVAAVPDALRRWVRFAGRKKGLRGDLVAETLAAVDQFAPGFREAMADPSGFGPAKSLVAAMIAEGVDPTDEQALGRWIEDFNSRPIEERDAILAWPGPGAGDAAASPARAWRAPRARTRPDDRAGTRPDNEGTRHAWAMPPARGRFQGMDLELLDPHDPDERSILLEAEHPELARALRRHEEVEIGGQTVNPRIHLALHEIVANQLWDGDPPETWAAARRLTDLGHERHDALHLLMRVVSEFVFAAMRDPTRDRSEDMRRALDALGRDGSVSRQDRLH